MKKLFVTYIFVCLALAAGAQNMTSSPYSRFAYGDLGDDTPNTFRGMGGVGIGMRSNKAINPLQPASYTGCDSTTFMFDLAGSVLWTTYVDASGRRNRANGATYAGEGGITEVYGGLSFNIMDWFAVGANVYYMFGEVSNYRALTFTEAGMQDVAMYSMLNVSSVRTRVGAQLFHTFDNQDAFAVGAVWEPQLPLRGKYTVVETSWGDTVQSGGAAMKVPMQWGVGASYTWQQRLTLAFDYTYQGWGSVQTFSNQALRSRAIYAAGVEYRHNPYGRNYVERVCWRLGAKLTDPYQKNVEGKEIKVSIGVGFPLRNAGTVFNATVEYGHRGALLKEDYLKLTINAAINETWFFKRKL